MLPKLDDPRLLARLQFLLDQQAPVFPHEIERTDEEVEAMYDAGLIEAGYNQTEPVGRRMAILSLKTKALLILEKKNLHLPRVATVSPPMTLSKTIGLGIWNILLETWKAVLGFALGWLAKKYLGQ